MGVNRVIYEPQEHITFKKELPNYYEEVKQVFDYKIGVNRSPICIFKEYDEFRERPLDEEEYRFILSHRSFFSSFLKKAWLDDTIDAFFYLEGHHVVCEEVDSILYALISNFLDNSFGEYGYQFKKAKKKYGLHGIHYFVYYVNIMPVVVLNHHRSYGIPLEHDEALKLCLKKG